MLQMHQISQKKTAFTHRATDIISDPELLGQTLTHQGTHYCVSQGMP